MATGQTNVDSLDWIDRLPLARMRAGECAPTPSADTCRYCDWRAMRPELV